MGTILVRVVWELGVEVDVQTHDNKSNCMPEKLHTCEINYFYSLTNIIKVIKPRWMQTVGHVTAIGTARNMYKFHSIIY
jgi:hypothetical protein